MHRSQAVLVGAMMARLLLSVLVTAALGRMLPPTAFGFFALVATIVLLGIELLDLGTNSVATREIARDPDRERSLLEGFMGWRRVAGLVLGCVVAAIALTQDDPGRRWVLLGTAALLPAMAPGALYPAFQVRQAQGGPALLQVATQTLVLVGTFVLYMLKVPGVLFAWLIVGREALNMLGLRILATRLLGFRPRAGLRGRGLRAVLAASMLYGLAALLHSAYFHCDVFLVSAMRGEIELGAYAAAFRPINPLLVAPWILMVPLLPVMAVAAREDRARFAAQVGSTAGLLLGIGATGAVAGVILAPDLLWVLYGGNYLEGDLSAVTAFRWLSVAFGVAFVMPVFANAVLADGRERVLVMLVAGGFLFNVAGNVLFIPRHGFVAAAVVTAITEAVVCAGALALHLRSVPRVPMRWTWFGLLVPAAAVGGVLLVLDLGPAVRVSAGVALGAAAVAALIASPAGRRQRSVTAVVPDAQGTEP